jgi:thiopeptide-type bacteriocin biosynthesis protein
LQALLREPVIREAIFIASPDLDHAIERWLNDPGDPKAEATERAVLRYVTRMASRATPFGLFAGAGVGTLGETTRIVVSDRASCRRHTRLDMDYLALLTDTLARDPRLVTVVRYTPNSGLYRAGDRWRLVETRLQDRNRSQHLVAVDDSDAITSTIERARAGASRATLAAALVDDDVTADEADAFVGELIDTQMLVPDLECPVTGPEPVAYLVDVLTRAPEGKPVADVLEQARLALAEIDAGGLGAVPARYRSVTQLLERLPAKVDIARLFQVDLVRPAMGTTIDRRLVDDIVGAVDVLRRLNPGGDHDELARFRSAFSERYERREVPLVEALDEEAGIGTALVEGAHRDPSPLLRGLDFPPSPMPGAPWRERESFLLRRAGEALIAGDQEIALTPRDIAKLSSDDLPPLPDACSVMATLIAPRTTDASDTRVLLQHVSGPSGANLLGRFCHADPELLAHVATHLHEEEAIDPDAVFAEVVHLPEGRLGNVLLRPVLRRYEIPYLGRSGAPPDRQIPITDLTVQLCDGRFVVRSRRLGRRIVPRLTSAHNFTARTLNIYRFLCLLQSEGRLHSWSWNWGALSDLPFLPRVTYGRFVLARATWRLTRDDIHVLTREKAAAARYSEVQRWRTARRLPRWIILADYDNTLPVDLDNALAVESLIQLLKNRDAATLTEMYPGADDLCAAGDDGRYVHELLIPLVKETQAHEQKPSPLVLRSAPASTQRTFAPGSEWLFAKLYASPPTSDRLLTEIIGPVCKRLLSRGLIDGWFFVRYADPDEHLRWRLHVAGNTRAATVQRHVERAAATAMSRGLVRRLAFDTYEREIERYGGDTGIEVAEQWFWADSDAIVQLLDPVHGIGFDLDLRWRCAIAGVDALLSDFNFDLPARIRLIQGLRDVFGREFHADAAFVSQLAARYRIEKPALERLLGAASPDAPWHEAFAARSTRTRNALARLQQAQEAGRLHVPIETLAESYVHMHLNRLFRSEQRAHELVIYDFLSCAYEGRAARQEHC